MFLWCGSQVGAWEIKNMKTKIRFSIPIFKENKCWDHKFTTSVELPKWIPYEDREEQRDEDSFQPLECESVRENLLARELKRAPKGTLWRGFVEQVDMVDGEEVWVLGS